MMLILVLMTGCAAKDNPSSSGAPTPPDVVAPIADPTIADPTSEETQDMSKGALPSEVQQAVLNAVAAEQNVSADQLQVSEAEEADWPDACLGLAKPDEMCAQMITPGWAITVTDGQNTWQYRIDLDASQVKLAGA